MSNPPTPAESEKRLGQLILGRFEKEQLGYAFSPQLKAAFLYGWKRGNQGYDLAEVMGELKSTYPEIGSLAEAIAYGQVTGYASFMRADPDYEWLKEKVESGELAKLIGNSS